MPVVALENAGDLKRDVIARQLKRWRSDGALAGVRDDLPLSRLDSDERRRWQSLWKDVDGLLEKTAAKK